MDATRTIFLLAFAISACDAGSPPDALTGGGSAAGGAGGDATTTGSSGTTTTGSGGVTTTTSSGATTTGSSGGGVGPATTGSGGAGSIDASDGSIDASHEPAIPRDDAPADRSTLADASPDAAQQTGRFSFFYTSLRGMQRLSNSQAGFGGDLRFGESTGLAGADKICKTLAADVGFGQKTWRAFLSIVQGPNGLPVHAIDRIGDGPWYDRRGRLIAMNKAGLIVDAMFGHPMGDPVAVADLPDETGMGTMSMGDTHDVITASDITGHLKRTGLSSTCQDWTSIVNVAGALIQVGHSWQGGRIPGNWIDAHLIFSCAPGVNLVQLGETDESTIGSGGGWGGFYCFALEP